MPFLDDVPTSTDQLPIHRFKVYKGGAMSAPTTPPMTLVEMSAPRPIAAPATNTNPIIISTHPRGDWYIIGISVQKCMSPYLIRYLTRRGTPAIAGLDRLLRSPSWPRFLEPGGFGLSVPGDIYGPLFSESAFTD